MDALCFWLVRDIWLGLLFWETQSPCIVIRSWKLRTAGSYIFHESDNFCAKCGVKVPRAPKPKIDLVLPEMVYVEGGSFNMGSDNDDDFHAKPIHQITLSSFYIGKFPVTQSLWEAIMDNNPSMWRTINDNSIVERVSWDHAQEFITKLNEQTGKRYGLPTEAEWEYAARGGNKSMGYTYSGSNDLGSVAWYCKNSSEKIHPAGEKLPNELGIYDMNGNVDEWCQDWFDEYYYANSPIQDPKGPDTGTYRVYRGRCFQIKAQYCSVASRDADVPSFRQERLGFRLVLIP